MPLINLQTNLKSLKYGDFGVEKPFITKDINNPPNESGLEKAATHRVDDLKRFTKFLTSGNGFKWAANQGALNILEAGIKSVPGKGPKSFAGQLVSGGWSTTKLIASTTAQIPVNGTGTHFVEGFGGKSGYLRKIQGHVLSRNGANIDVRGILENSDNPEIGKNNSKVLNRFLLPGSIKTWNSSTNSYEFEQQPKKKLIQKIFGGGNPQPEDLEYRSNSILKDVGFSYGAHSVTAQAINKIPESGSYSDGKPKKRNAQGFVNNKDVINARMPVSSSLNSINAELKKASENEPTLYKGVKDLIKFNFVTIIPRSNNEDGPLVTVLPFRAYLDSFSDTYNGDWGGTRYLGRAEELYSYSGFTRSIQFGFKVVAHTQAELEPLYNKLNKLVGSTAPSYMSQNYMRGTFNKLTVGDYLVDMPGFISNISLTWNTDYSWNTSLNTDTKELPTILDVQVSYQPIHTKAPTAGMDFIGAKPPKNKTTSNPEEEGDIASTSNDESVAPTEVLDEVVITG